MGMTVGIRREDKNKWEARVPLIPSDLASLKKDHDIEFLVQPSTVRAYPDAAYRDAGAEVVEDLGPAGLVVAVKEIPTELLREGRVYVFFAHVIKGQAHNMPMLRKLLELGCSLVNYERIVDEQNRRLIFFGRHAGLAGMVETLWGLGQRLKAGGVATPFAEVRHAHEYADLEALKAHLSEIGDKVSRDGLPEALRPLVFGIAGYGNVSRGAQEILSCLPIREVAVPELGAVASAGSDSRLVQVVFEEQHMVRPKEPGDSFELQDYYRHPERYQGNFEEHLPHLDVLVNTIYWDERYPRLVTREWAREQFRPLEAPRLKVVGDISCDIAGSIELTVEVTQPDAPCFVYDPNEGAIRNGVEGPGLVVMAVDNLPCELPREASQDFSRALRDMLPALSAADWSADFDQLGLPPHLQRAVIVHKGQLTPDYVHLERHLDSHLH